VILAERIALANDKYSMLEQRSKNLESENERLRLDLEKAQIQIKQLQERIVNHEGLRLQYGVYWDKDGNPHCPRCKLPISQIKWATCMNGQYQALKCSCSKDPFVLMEKGEPLQAPEVMKSMSPIGVGPR
jgi:hypothetical protein